MGTSAGNFSSEQQFQGKSQGVRDLYNSLLNELNQIGPVRESSRESSIHLESRRTFASAKIRDRSIYLTFRTDYPIENKRVKFLKKVAEDKFQHVTRLGSKRDLDAELIQWLSDAYQLGK